MGARRNGRQTLAGGLDKEVYQVVRKILDDQTQFSTGEAPKISFAYVYDQIRGSNSSLNRRPKKLLEDSLERVLDTIRGDQEDDNDSDEQLDLSAKDEPPKPLSNGLNKSIVSAWSNKPPIESNTRSGTATPSKRDRQPNGEPILKKRKTERAEKPNNGAIDHTPPTHITLSDMGGIGPIVNQLLKLVALPMLQPHLFSVDGPQPTRGILLHGPPGCGKTMIANALAASLKTNFISISAPSIVSGMSGESEKALRDHFEEAKKAAPCLMFIDEIDAITPKREAAQREMEKRIVAQLLTCLDDLDLSKTDGKPVIVLAATNRPDSLDPALRRGGRFDKEIIMPVPNEQVREQILMALTRKWTLAPDVDFKVLARRTPGCVGADLKDLVSTAANMAMERYLKMIEEAADAEGADGMEVDNTTSKTGMSQDPAIAHFEKIVSYCLAHPLGLPTMTTNDNPTPAEQQLDNSSLSTTTNTEASTTTTTLTQTDFLSALKHIQPSALREGFATVPTTTFADIGSLQSHIAHLTNHLIAPILHPSLYNSLNLPLSTGVLLYGPPGTGKTLLAKAVANASHANFISVKGPELLNKFVGESERAVRTLFSRARSSVPVIIFFDELDALVPRRDGAMSEASSRVVNTLLTELDGVGNGREGIYVVAATNRPDMIDSAMLRPGRLETLLYVGLPDAEGRIDILKTLVNKLSRRSDDVVATTSGQVGLGLWDDRMEELARGCAGFSGADLQGLVRRAGFRAVEKWIAGNKDGVMIKHGPIGAASKVEIMFEDFAEARKQVVPSVSAEEHARFLLLKKDLENKM